MDFDFSLEPGKTLNKINFENEDKIVVSIVMPFYNDKKYFKQAVTSVLNQTYPYYEVLIIDDGSTDEEALKELEEFSQIDKRIKVFHKENAGPAAARDYGAEQSSKDAKYLFFLDSDDLIDKTYLECAVWTLETNPDASWAYADSVGFDGKEYIWNKWYNTEKLKKVNDLVLTALIRKDDFNEVNGFGLNEKSVHEDWNMWLKLIAKGKFPVRMNFYGFWYRRKDENSELTRANNNKKRANEIINATKKKINPSKEKPGKQYPLYNYNWDLLKDDIEFEAFEGIKIKENAEKESYEQNLNKQNSNAKISAEQNSNAKNSITKNSNEKNPNNKINLLFIIPWMVVGGADKFNLDLIKGLDKNKFSVTVLLTEPAENVYRQEFEQYATVYDLTTFLDIKYWINFINYIIKKNNISLIFNSNSEAGYNLLPYLKAKFPEIPIVDYVHMEEWYNRNGGYSRDSSSVASVIDKTLTCNKNSQRILHEHFGRDEFELDTVYIGVDEEKFKPVTDSEKIKKFRKEFGVDKKYVIGFICRITEQKRPYLLLEIIKKLKETRNDFVFLIAGDGNLFNKIKSKAKKYGLSGNVIFLGNYKDTNKFYAACDMTLNCSIKEGLALTSYESTAMGVPVISSDVGGQKELITDDVGVIVPCLQNEEDIFDFNYSDEEINSYVDGINKIIENIDKYKENCRDRVLKYFTINKMIENMSKIFEETVNNPNAEKIANGKTLAKNIDVTKELIVKEFAFMQGKYEWECKEYNEKYYIDPKKYKWELFKEKMWKHAVYRAFIKFLQKVGIIKLLKKESEE